MSLLVPSNLIRALLTTTNVCIDGFVFRLYYKTTVAILVIFSIVIGLFQFFGDPIDCAASNQQGDGRIIDTYCWTYASHLNDNQGKKAQNTFMMGTKVSESEHYYLYYKWVFFLLLVQAFFFYLPHVVWKWLEGNRIKELTADLNFLSDAVKQNEVVTSIIDHWEESVQRNENNSYLSKYVVCTFMNFFCLISQVFLIDYFLGNQFISYGIDMAKYTFHITENPEDPRTRIFPKVATCNFYLNRNSGQADCVLPLNDINDKIFLFLWFWFAILGIATVLHTFIWCSTMCIHSLRVFSLIKLARVSGYGNYRRKLSLLMIRCSVGDWFIMYLLGHNMKKSVFNSLILGLPIEATNKVENGDLDQMGV